MRVCIPAGTEVTAWKLIRAAQNWYDVPQTIPVTKITKRAWYVETDDVTGQMRTQDTYIWIALDFKSRYTGFSVSRRDCYIV